MYSSSSYVESERGTLPLFAKEGSNIFSCDIDKILMDQNYVKSHVISQLNLTMRLNQQEAFRSRMVGKTMSNSVWYNNSIWQCD